jgi:type IV pilus assembly protein PilA
MKATQGFTLIELMIVIAIIGILVAIAIPTYQDFTVRGRVAEALTLSSILRQTISENYFSRGGYLNGTIDCQGISNTTFNSDNIRSISCNTANSSISILTTAKAGSITLKLTPTVNSQRIDWTCSISQASEFKYVPPECRNL